MSVLAADSQDKILDELVKQEVLTRAELDKHKAAAKNDSKNIIAYLEEENVVAEEQLTHAHAEAAGLPYVNLSETVIDPTTLHLLPQEVAERFMAVPLGTMGNRLVVAMLDANNVQAADFLSQKIGQPIKVYMASESGIHNVLSQYTTNLERDLGGVMAKEPDEGKEGEKAKGAGGRGKDIKTIVQDSPISKALNTILEYAAKTRASDIHIEPLEDALKIRTRIDGVMREIMRLPKSVEPALVSRVKILSNLKIDEHRAPQDGQFTVKVGDNEIDLRIAISPVVWGEQVVIRLLDKSGTSLKLEAMGYAGRALRAIRKGIKQPNGMVLTSGPTGSGKSTSLYALIQEIMSDEINIVTLEDPVEYKMQGINQIQVNPEVGLSFSSGLRSILRQDPDVVMVGEIRDAETANLAVQAALTGHLVFATLHTNSAAGVLPRLLDMGVEPFLIASTVNTVIGQRLVRRIADEGKESYESGKVETTSIKETLGDILPKDKTKFEEIKDDLGYDDLPLADQNAYTLYKGEDTKKTPGGYKGRVGLYEVMDVDESIEELILKRAASSEIQKKAQKNGMLTMREDGYLKALNGLTTLDEVNRVAAIDSA
jgi:type IV pilus assembly protein PilB